MKSQSKSQLLLLLLVAPLATCARASGDTKTSEGPAVEARAFTKETAPIASGSVTHAQSQPACPASMTLVEGEHCPVVEHRCLGWMDPPGKYHQFRCVKYAEPAVCKAKRVHMRFCIDTDEQGATATDPRPANHVSYKVAKAACEARGARLCNESEWEFACEGEEMRPYPYGFVRDSTLCNVDRENVTGPGGRGLHDLRRKVGEDDKCVSPFGVRDMAGNMEEWATMDRKGLHTKSTLLKGSWWLKGKHTCRATNGGHDDWYQSMETGYRCCQ